MFPPVQSVGYLYCVPVTVSYGLGSGFVSVYYSISPLQLVLDVMV